MIFACSTAFWTSTRSGILKKSKISWFATFLKEKFEKSSDFHKKINFSFFSTLQTLVIVLTDFWFSSYISRYVILKILDFQISRFLPRFLKEFLKEMRQNIWKSDFRWTSNWCWNRASWWILMEPCANERSRFHFS